MPQETGITIVVEGRVFVQEVPSFEQELYIMDQCIAAGLVEQGSLKLDASQNLPLAVQQMLIRAYRSGALFRLMAALITEQGTEWTQEQALLNADFFRKVRDPESKKALQTALVGAILAFFESAVSSDLTSHISLDDIRSGQLDGVTLTPRLSEKDAAAVFASGSMPSRSEKSPITTGSTRKSSSGGKSAKG